MKNIYIIYGVSGCGKSTIAKSLSQQLEIEFYDADDYHLPESINKMQNGIPLVDEDRYLWLEVLNAVLLEHQNKGAVLACSALKEKYRKILSKDIPNIKWVLLDGDFDLIKQRLEARNNHFMSSSLLQSQFDDLEKAPYGSVINIQNSIQNIVSQITSNMNQKADIGVIGLGVMGRSLALNLLDKQWKVAVYNRDGKGEEHIVSEFIEYAKNERASGYTDYNNFVSKLDVPRKILLMVPAGHTVDAVIDTLVPLLSSGDILIDAGNSHFEDTNRRELQLKAKNISFLGMGVSGGEKGARFGPAMMPGGNAEVYKSLSPIFESISAKNPFNDPCCGYIGKGGSGHFVKMIHNGIEYAEMALIAELYSILRIHNSNEKIAEFFESLNEGNTRSYLVEITASILRKKEQGEFVLDAILDKAGNKGTGGWSIKAALDLGQAATMMAAAVHARYTSSFKSERVINAKRVDAVNNQDFKFDLETLSKIYQSARIVNHHQGFEVIKAASEKYNWNINLAQVANIWSSGCIIRSKLIEECISIFDDKDDLLSHDPYFNQVNLVVQEWKNLIVESLNLNESLAVFSAGLQYWLAMTNEHSNANMIQAQRDYFGAHTYERKDNPGMKVHTKWEE